MTPGYKERRKAKHHAQNNQGFVEPSFRLEAQFDSPDTLGLWEGGPVALKSPNFGLKSRPHVFGDRKNTPGKASGEVVQRSEDFYHGKKRDPQYKARVEAAAIAAAEAVNAITQEDNAEPTPAA
jgi:hypothetical protein